MTPASQPATFAVCRDRRCGSNGDPDWKQEARSEMAGLPITRRMDFRRRAGNCTAATSSSAAIKALGARASAPGFQMRDASILLTLIGYSEAEHGFCVDEIASGRLGLGIIGRWLRNSGADF
jgi:hypothetical protein